MDQRLYIVHGIGNDAVGLVGKITSSIAQANGNIVDLRQDVMHGLFTIYLVVDLTASTLSLDEFQHVLQKISEETDLKISVDLFTPIPRSAEKKNMLLILLGKDKPGIVATVSKALSSYNINIEFSQMIAREDIFLMDLLTDVSKSILPMENLKKVVREKMLAMHIKTMFQSEDVFNKKKKIILFDIASSFIDQPTLREIVRQTHIAPETIASTYSIESISTSLLHAVSHLEDLPIEVLNTIIDTIEISPSTMELIQTLKIMGYKIGLMSNGFAPFTDSIKKKLDIDYCFGIDIPVDDDAKMIIRGLSVDELKIPDRQQIFAKLKERESVGEEDITIITDLDMQTLGTPGIRLQFNMKIILDYFNQHILNREALIGLLGSFGIPRLA